MKFGSTSNISYRDSPTPATSATSATASRVGSTTYINATTTTTPGTTSAISGGWGSRGLSYVEAEALIEYERCFCTPEAIHAACEDYRASAGIDLVHDRESRARGEKIACGTQVLLGERGVVQQLFQPPALWQAQYSATVSGQALPAGHYIPEELPLETAHALAQFFNDTGDSLQN
jgi:hypothetical protein